MWVASGGKGWLSGGKMAQWLERAYHGHIEERGQVPSSTLLFMDNCASHVTVDCISTAERLHLPWHTLPPHMTPLLQPLDQYVNSTLKREYGRCWEEWFEGPGGDEKTKYGNPRRATADEVNRWIATALQCIDANLIRKCWEHTMDAEPYLLRLPQRAYQLIQSYLPLRLRALFQAEGTIGKRRAEVTAEDFVFPDKVRSADYVPYQRPWGPPEAEDVLRPIRSPLLPGPPLESKEGDEVKEGKEGKEEKEEKEGKQSKKRKRTVDGEEQGKRKKKEKKAEEEEENKDARVVEQDRKDGERGIGEASPYSSMTGRELQLACRHAGLAVGGGKADLVERLTRLAAGEAQLRMQGVLSGRASEAHSARMMR